MSLPSRITMVALNSRPALVCFRFAFSSTTVSLTY